MSEYIDLFTSNKLSIFLGVGLLIGLISSLIPQIPGTLVLLFTILVYSHYTDYAVYSKTVLGIIIVLVLIGGFGQYAITGWASTWFGGSKYSAIWSCILMPFGFLLPVPGGMLAGAFVGAFIGEYYFNKKADQDVEGSLKAAVGAAIGTVLSVFFEFFSACIIFMIAVFKFVQFHV